ncbi:MAG: HAD-IC family P-type ATPase, partial [Collinsella sp.]|nr:HAD-IC family P-type ATPase [Collinsella sp.]
AMAKADTIVFDKTGTLTHATPTVARVVPFGGRDERSVLCVAACLEEHYPHSMANAVVKEALRRGISHEEMHSEVEYVVAHGIASRIDGEKMVIGSYHFVFEDEGCVIPAGEQERFDALPPEYSHLYLAMGGTLAGVICVADPLREEASAVLNSLRKLGISKAVMMTGDNERTAAVIAKEVGVDEYFAEVLPEDKARFVEQEKAAGRTVVMIGDGINDSPALARADVGLAIGTGADIAKEGADVVLMRSDLMDIARAIELSRATIRNIKQDLFWALFYNGIGIPLAAGVFFPLTGWQLSPMFGATAMSLSSVCVVSNALRLKSFKPKVAK